jgi:hypothetical protein
MATIAKSKAIFYSLLNIYKSGILFELNMLNYICLIICTGGFYMKNIFKRKNAKEQITPFKDLKFFAKIAYIWEYYKYYMIAFVLIVITILSFVKAYKRNNYETDFSMAIIDGRITDYDNNSDAITTGFTHYLGIDGIKHRVICDYNYSLKQQAFDQEQAITQDKIYTLASTGNLDGYMSEKEEIDHFSSDDEPFLMDLREILSLQELDKIQDSILYYTYEDGRTIPFAVDLTNTKIKTKTDLTMKNPCYGVVVTAPNQDNAVAFIRYAFDL